MLSANSAKVTFGSQPNFSLALEGFATKVSTYAGR